MEANESSCAGLHLAGTIIENLEDLSVEEVIEQFDVTREQVKAVLEFVAESLRAEGLSALLPGHTVHTGKCNLRRNRAHDAAAT